MHGQQLSKRVFKKQLNLQQNSNLFLRLKAEVVQLLNQIDLYRDHHRNNYNLTVQRISCELSNCTSQQQGELCLLLCQTGINMKISLLQLPLPRNFAQLVISYINNLLQKKEDISAIRNHTTRQVYGGKFKATKQKKQRLDNQQKLRDLLLIQRIDPVLAFVVEYLRQRQSKCRLSKIVIDHIGRTKDLAYHYLGSQEYQKYQRNLSIIAFNPKSTILREATSTPIYRNFVIIGQKDTDFMDREIDMREYSSKEKSFKRTSSKLQLLQRNSSFISIDSSNSIEPQQQKRTIKGSQRLKGSLKRSGSSLSKRGSIEVKKSPEYLVRKSIHFTNKQVFEIKPGTLKNQRKSRFQAISKLDIDSLKDQSLIHKYQNELNESESVQGSKKQAFKMPRQEELPIFCNKIKDFYVYLSQKNRLWSLILKPIVFHLQDIKQQGVLGRQKQFQLLFEDYLVFYCSKSNNCQYENVSQLYYLQKLANLLVPKRNFRNELVFSNKQLQGVQNNRKNVFQVSNSQQILLMGFIRKASTHFIIQCLFDRSLIQNCYELGIKRRLLTPNSKLSFKIVYSYKLMNQDLYMTYYQNRNMCTSKGSIISNTQQRSNNQNITVNSEQKYKIAISQFTVKESDQEIDFITIWKRHTEIMYYQIPKFKRKQTRSGTEIITKQKVNTAVSDNKRIKRIPHNKSSIRLHQSDVEKILQNNNFSLAINSTTRTCSKKQFPSTEKVVQGQRILKKENRKKKCVKSGKQLIESIRTEKGYKLVRRCIVQNSNGITYSQYYGYLERRANLIEYHQHQSTSFSTCNQNNYLKSRMTIHGKKSKLQPSNTKLLTFLKRLKNDSSLLGYLVGSIKLLRKDKNRYIYMEVYWCSMQKYFIFILSQDIFQKMTQIELDQFEKHSFSTPIEKQSKKREKKTSVMSSLLRYREKQASNLKKSNESRINTLRVPKVLSIQRDNYQSNSKTQTSNKLKDTSKNLSSNWRTNNFFRSEKTSESFSFSSFGKLKWSQRLQFKRQVAAYIKNKLIRYMEFSWKNYNLILELRHPNLDDYVEIHGKELAVKNIHFYKKRHMDTQYKQSYQSEISATQLLVIKYKQSNLANLNFYTCQGLSKIYLEHIFIKNSDHLFGCYKSNICLRQINDNRYRIDAFYSSQNGFFQQGSKGQNLLPISQPVLRHFNSKHSNKDEQKRYKFVQIINYAKKCSLSFDFIEKKRKKMLKNMFVIPNRYPHLNLKQFMLTLQMTFEEIQIRDLNGSRLLAFQKQKLLNYFPYLSQLSKMQLKKLMVQRLLKDPDLIRLCQSHLDKVY